MNRYGSLGKLKIALTCLVVMAMLSVATVIGLFILGTILTLIRG